MQPGLAYLHFHALRHTAEDARLGQERNRPTGCPKLLDADHGVLVKKELAKRPPNCPRLSDDAGDLIPLREMLYCDAQ